MSTWICLLRASVQKWTVNAGPGGAGIVVSALLLAGAIVAIRGNAVAGTGTAAKLLAGHRDAVLSLDWSPDGERLVSGSMDNTVRVWHVASATEERRIGEIGPAISEVPDNDVRCVAYSRDGRWIAAGDFWGHVTLFPATGAGSNEELRAGDKGAAFSLAWSPNGEWLTTGNGDGTVRAWPAGVARRTSRVLVADRWNAVLGLCWSPDSARIACGLKDGTLLVCDASGGREVWRAKAHEGSVFGVSWSPAGGLIASCGADATVRLWESGSGACRGVLKPGRKSLDSVAWNATGRSVACSGWDGVVRLWDAQTLKVRRLLEVKGDTALGLAWSSKQSLIAVGTGRGNIWVQRCPLYE